MSGPDRTGRPPRPMAQPTRNSVSLENLSVKTKGIVSLSGPVGHGERRGDWKAHSFRGQCFLVSL